jgi:hypothetical protein
MLPCDSATPYRLIRLVSECIECRFQFQPFRLKLAAVGILRNPDRVSPGKARPAERQGDLKAVPASKEFFFEAAKVSGRIGNPVSLAS